MNLWPLCTANVSPTMSGTTIERRDQVRMIRLSPEASAAATLRSRWPSMNGPFLSDLILVLPDAYVCLTFSLGPAAHDVVVRRLLAARLVTLGRLSPWRLWMIALGTSLAAAVRMVDRIHRHPAHVRAFA